MPDTVAQRRTAAIAKHHPEDLYKRNRGLLKMGSAELDKWASTKEAGLKPGKKKRKKKH